MNNFVGNEPDADTRRRLEQATSHEELRAILKDSLAQQGVLARTQDGGYSVVEAPVIVQRPALPRQEPTCMRVFYPWNNSRFEIYGTSEADLDQQETAIRNFYQGRQ